MILYEKGTTNFTKNGLGYLNNVISAKVTEELNGEYSLVFDYPLNEVLSNELIEERIVKCKVSDGTNQCFIIKNVVKTYEKMTITCSHLFYLLLTDLAEDIYPQNLSPKPFLDWILARANYVLPFTTTSDVSIQKTGRYVRRNLVDVILGEQKNSMVNLFGIEIKRNNWNIALNARLGADRGEKLLYGKNITGINLTIDTNELYTRIMPIGFDGLILPEKYIDADNINDYPYPKIGLFEFSDIRYDPEDPSAYHDIEDAYDALRNAVEELYANHVNEPKINIKINWLELSKTEEYKQYSNLERVELGDTIHAEIFGLNYTTRVIKTVYNPLTDRIEQFEIGSFQASYATQMNQYEFDLQTINPASILQEAQNNATSLITQAMGGYVYKTNNELYIMDNENPSEAVHVWRWNINGLGYSSTGINGTYGLAMTMDGQIVADFITTGVLRTSVIQGYDSLVTEVTNNSGQISTLTQSVGELNSKIQDIADITTAAESEYAQVDLLNVNESQPIMIKIHPTTTSISYLYPRATGLYPSDTLYMPDRRIKFTNTSTNEVFYYELFDDLLYYDSTHYDEFYFDYDNDRVQITKRCEYAADGSVVLKASEVVETTTFPTEAELYLSTGNYTITLPGYSNAYLMVRCMASNIYTAQFLTKSELSQTASQIRTEVSATYATKNELATTNSTITQTADSIRSEVAQTYQTKSAAEDDYDSLSSSITQTATEINTEVAQKVGKTEVISSINQSAEEIQISANKVNISGVITAINNDTSTTINGNKITTGSITASKVSSDIITTSNFGAQNINASKITTGTLNGNNVTITNLKAGNITGGTLNGIPLSNCRFTFTGSGQTLVITSGTGTLLAGFYGTANYSNSRFAIYSYDSGGRFQTYDGNANLGAFLAYGGVFVPSDIRYKKHIKEIEEQKSINIITNLTPIEYDYDTEDKHRGLSAQQVEEVLNKNDFYNQVYFIDKGRYSLRYEELIPDLINCIKYQQKEIDKLKKEMEELKNGLH